MGQPSKLLTPGLANPGGYAITPEQAQWARCRPEGERTTMPRTGQRGWYRHRPGGELVPAEVVSVASDESDPNVFKTLLDDARVPVLIDGARVMVLVDDPRPSLLLKTQGYGMIETREARLDGMPGWVP